MPAQQSVQPKTLAEDLRSRSDDELAGLLHARPDLLHPVPSDMRALTTRAATSPSIARYLDTVDSVHHFALRIASEQTSSEATSADQIVEAIVAALDDESIRPYAVQAVTNLRSAAVLWGSGDRMHVITAVRDQVAAAPEPRWPAPTCSGEQIDSALVDHTNIHGGAKAHGLIATIEEVCDLWQLSPGPVLRSGGLSARALDSLAEQLGDSKEPVAISIDLARSAGLLAQGSTGSDIGWMPTAEYASWCAESASKRWATLARVWMNRPGITGPRPLADNEHAFAAVWRHQLLTTLADATHSCDLSGAIEVIDFRWPRRRGAKRNEVIAASWAEAERLGIVVDGILTDAGRALASDESVAKLATTISASLTPEVDEVHIQADHTVVAPGPLEPSIGTRLRMIADVESRGHATVFRLSNASIKRALSLDPDPTSWQDFLEGIGSKGLPQPVAYLIADAARTAPKKQSLHAAPAEPTPVKRARITATPARIDKALDVLRARENRQVSELVADFESADVPAMESGAVVATLRYSIDHHETVRITHAESDGSTAALLVDPIRLGGGSLTAYDHHEEQVRTFAISRISGVASVRISA